MSARNVSVAATRIFIGPPLSADSCDRKIRAEPKLFARGAVRMPIGFSCEALGMIRATGSSFIAVCRRSTLDQGCDEISAYCAPRFPRSAANRKDRTL